MINELIANSSICILRHDDLPLNEKMHENIRLICINIILITFLIAILKNYV